MSPQCASTAQGAPPPTPTPSSFRFTTTPNPRPSRQLYPRPRPRRSGRRRLRDLAATEVAAALDHFADLGGPFALPARVARLDAPRHVAREDAETRRIVALERQDVAALDEMAVKLGELGRDWEVCDR